MDRTIPVTSSTTDDTSTFNRQHEYNFFLDRDNQKTLLQSTDDDDDVTDPQPPTSVPMVRLLDNDAEPWSSSGWVHRTSGTTSPTSVHHRTRGPRINYVARYSTGNRTKDIPFNFHHYVDPSRYMEQYRRDYTYANLLDLDDQFPWADHRLRQTTQCQTGRTGILSKRHSASSIDLEDQRLDWSHHHRAVRDSTSVDGLSRALRRNLEEFENSETSGPSSTNKFWTFDANHVLPVVYTNNSNSNNNSNYNTSNNNTVGTGRSRYLGGSTMELVGGLAAAVFSGKEAKHFPGNGFAIDDQSVKRLSSRVSNLQLPIAGLRAIDILTHNSHARARLTQQHRSLGVSTTLPVIR